MNTLKNTHINVYRLPSTNINYVAEVGKSKELLNEMYCLSQEKYHYQWKRFMLRLKFYYVVLVFAGVGCFILFYLHGYIK